MIPRSPSSGLFGIFGALSAQGSDADRCRKLLLLHGVGVERTALSDTPCQDISDSSALRFRLKIEVRYQQSIQPSAIEMGAR